MTGVSEAGALIASIPWLVAHTPQQALVVITTRRGYIGATTVIDLGDDAAVPAAAVSTWAAAIRADAATVVIVAADAAGVLEVPKHHRALVAALIAVLANRDIHLVDAYLVDQIAKGATWIAAAGIAAHGVVDDPAMTAVAMHAIVSGRNVYPSRDELHQAVALTADQRAGEVAALLDAHTAAIDDECSDQTAQIAIRGVIEVAKRVSRGRALSDDEYVFVAHALSSQRIRDMLLGLAITSKSGRVELLWTQLAHDMPHPRRADVLALLAFFAYSRGDQPLADTAASAALTSHPDHPLASVLDQALRHARQPHRIWQLAAIAYTAAELADVPMPRRVLWTRLRAR